MRAGLYLEDELFCWISADVVCQYSDARPPHIPQEDGTLGFRFMMHSGRFVHTVCDKRRVRQVKCSPLQHCTALPYMALMKQD